MIGIGIDTGGTCTDAVVYDLDTKEILATGKTLTTKSNLEIGIGKALDQLPAELLKEVQSFSLSTTLATNACVENKGSRAKLLIIGTTPEMIQQLEKILTGYGINDLSQLIVLDAKAENLYSEPFDPDWEDLRKRVPELFSDCDAVGIVQTFPDANGGRFELTALRILQEELTIPLTIAYDISQETDILKVCASTLLNARLIPLIREFMEAVHNVMKERGLDVPVSIVRSDGTLMSEEMARTQPVETLLCGPAASVIGGCELAGENDAILVDMGGTTTDLAIVRNNDPVMAKKGILIGQYQTAIKGLDAQAVSLGGDTAVRFRDGELFLDTERIIPISVLCEAYPEVLKKIQNLVVWKETHTRWIHEFFVLQRDISEKTGYTEFEHKACEVLKNGPLITRDFYERIGGDLYHPATQRLEQEGVIIRSGLTPTDIMVLRGDFDLYEGTAAEELIK
ncbi:MAG: hydantoinase/oxoprolinase family protein, partial [Lachnospiraceae bacterium]|nr:hydantoinase/oxoprolinase family protein [Lachnospiraceae bacterium]